MEIKVGKYYQDPEDGEVILIEKIGKPKDVSTYTIRCRSTRIQEACPTNTRIGRCKGCKSKYQTCWDVYSIKKYFKEISKAKGILLLGDLDEKASRRYPLSERNKPLL